MTGDGEFHFVRDELQARGAVVAFYRSHFLAPDGSEFVRDVIRHPGAVSAVAVDGEDVFLVRQYRAALDHDLWETPAGKRDVEGEATVVTIARELEEEIGMSPGHLEELMIIHQSPGFCDEAQNIYLATDLTPVSQRLEGVEEENMVVERVHRSEALTMCMDGRITDAKTICGLLAAGRKLNW